MTEFIIDGATTASSADGCASEAVTFEQMGLDAAWTFEASHDPFLPLALAAQQTDNIQLGTAIAVAFARNPMTCAVTAWDLQRLSNRPLHLGTGNPDKATYHETLQRKLVAARRENERIYCCPARYLGQLSDRRKARLSRRVLYPHPDDSIL